MKAQRCPQLMFEHHFEAACGRQLASHCLLSLPLTVLGMLQLLCQQDTVYFDSTPAFLFTKQLPHPKPLHCISQQLHANKTTASPSVSKPCCMVRTLTGPNGGQRQSQPRLAFTLFSEATFVRSVLINIELSKLHDAYPYQYNNMIRGLKLMSKKGLEIWM